MPAISSEGEYSCREQTAIRRSAVLDDPRRVAVDRRRQSLTRSEAGSLQGLDTTRVVPNIAM